MGQGEKHTGPSDIELISQALKGSKTAYTLLMRRYEQPMYRYLMRLTGSHADTDDLLQDLMLKLWSKMGDLQLKNEFSLHAWLKRTAFNAFVNYKERVDKADKKVSLDDDDVNYYETVSDDSPEDDVHDNLAANQIYRCLEKLPEKQRETVILRFIEGEKFQDIAAQMGVSESTAKTNASHGLKNLASACPELRELLGFSDE